MPSSGPKLPEGVVVRMTAKDLVGTVAQVGCGSEIDPLGTFAKDWCYPRHQLGHQ